VFATKDGPCYRCCIRSRHRPGSCRAARRRVLGVLPGMIGMVQATETVKLIMGIGEPLIGRFLIYDALRMRFRELKLRKDPIARYAERIPPLQRSSITSSSAASFPPRRGRSP